MKKAIVFFDLETTGVNVSKDRIVQIGAIKLLPDGTEEIKDVKINPTIPIPAGASAIHGIFDEDVQNQPTFRQISKSFVAWLTGCDLAGYNSDNFDVSMLIEEFNRVDIIFPEKDTNFIDVLKIERLVNSHKLEETYLRYSGKNLDNAHDALADVRATLEVFQQQLQKNPTLPTEAADLDEFCQGNQKRVDFAGKLFDLDGEIFWKFGKHKGHRLLDTVAYARWVLSSDFPAETKMQIQKVLGEGAV